MESALFCPSCGAFRDLTSDGGNTVTCEFCDYSSSLDKLTARMRNKAEMIQLERSELLLRMLGQSKKAVSKDAVIDEECPKCHHQKLSFTTAQLRGVDEGQTIFFTCLNPKCRHKFSVNS